MTLLTSQEAATTLRLKEKTLRTWRTGRGPKIPFVKVGRRVFYRQEDVDDFIQQRLVHQTTEAKNL